MIVRGGIEPEFTRRVAPPILLVDDDLALAQAMASCIDNIGLPVEHCATGEVAIELLRKKHYAVAVIDLILESGISGIYVVNAIRELPIEQRPLVLMITGANLESLRGVDRTTVAAVMLKPLDLDLFSEFVLATYRRAIHVASEAGVSAGGDAKVRTYCGICGAEINPWIFNPPKPADDTDTFQLWLDTPCAQCGTPPRVSGGRSEWTPAAAVGEALRISHARR